MRIINLLKDRLNYEQVGNFECSDVGLVGQAHGPIVYFVKTKYRGYDRFYCFITRKYDNPSFNSIWRVTARGDYLSYNILTVRQQKRIFEKYFENILMEELL